MDSEIKQKELLQEQQKQQQQQQQHIPILPPTPKDIILDEKLLSRQLAVYGQEYQTKFSSMNIFIQGMRGLGVEIAKNIILSNPHVVKIYDENKCSISDQGSNCYISDYDIQNEKTRSKACLPHLKQLNPNVHVLEHEGELTESFLSEFHVLVFTDYYIRDKLIAWNKMARAKNIAFIYTGLLGLYGFIFVDFGEEHMILDNNGEECKQAIISSISNDNKAVVTLLENHPNKKSHGFEDGDYVIFKEVEGMDEMNIQEPTQIKMLSKYCFEVQIDTTEFMPYTGRGIIEQVKIGEGINYKSLEESFRVGYGNNKTRFEGCENEEQEKIAQNMHVLLQGIIGFSTKHNNQLPQYGNEDHLNDVLQQITILNNSYKKTQHSLIIDSPDLTLARQLCYFAKYQIAPLATFYGGIVAQEVIKFTGKFTPIQQWLHVQNFELLPEIHAKGTIVNRNLINCRYDDYIAIFGKEFLDKLLVSKVFVVGAGALGCEYTKLFSLMGIACHKKGVFHLTDDDNIEISNLNRQFLFQRDDIGKSKSLIASLKGKSINPSLNIKSHKYRLDESTQNVFDDNFWMNLDFVVNAVDNVEARQYVDKQCVWYNKVLFESGTLGVKCNTQVIIPHQTQSYSDTIDPQEEEQIPACTLKHFPYLIQHCVQWAIDYFQGAFIQSFQQLNQFISNPIKYIERIKSNSINGDTEKNLEWIKRLLIIYNNPKYEECVQLSRELFEEVHNNQIAEILYNLPIESKNSYGAMYWSGQKRPPSIITFDSEDAAHLSWIHAAANLFAKTFNIKQIGVEETKQIVQKCTVPTFLPAKQNINNLENNSSPDIDTQDLEIKCNLLIEEIKNEIPSKKIDLQLTQDNKSDDSNVFEFQIITAISNLRARNYKIKEVDEMRVKVIAGKIIPALATTTAMAVGQIGIEIIKYTLSKPISVMRNSFMNSAMPFWVYCDLVEPYKNYDSNYDLIHLGPVRAVPKGFTKWDFISIDGPLRVSEFRDYFLENYDVIINKIYYDNQFLYDQTESKAQEYEQMDMQELYELIFKCKIPEYKQYIKLGLYAQDRKGNECKMPFVKYAYNPPEILHTQSDLMSQSASGSLEQAEENMGGKQYLSPSKQRKLEQYLEDQVRQFLNQLIIDALKERPTSFLKFSYEWLQLYKNNEEYIPKQNPYDNQLTPHELQDEMKEYLIMNVDIYIEELVFNLITKRPTNPLDFSIKWFFQKHKDDRLHIIKEQKELPGKEPLSVDFPPVIIEEFQAYNQEYEESRLRLQKLENQADNHQTIELAQQYEQYGLICMKFNKIQEAITYLKKSLFTLLKFEDKANSMETSRINFNLAELFDRQSQYIEAFRFYKEALWLQEQILGEDRIESVEILQRIGIILQKNKKYNSALMNFQKSYDIMKDNFNYECITVIKPLINLANCHLNLRNFDDALTYYKKVLRMYEKNNSMEENVENVSFLYNMSIAAENCRFFNDAISLTNEAFELGQICLPKNNNTLHKISDRIRQLHSLYNNNQQ